VPSHITHILLANEIYETGSCKQIDKDYFLTFSLGADLAKYSKVRKLSHKVKQKELILNMVSYVKDHNLTDDGVLIATIYGHMCHMVADNLIHPLIYQETKDCKNHRLKNHMLIESHYDNYLLQEKIGLEVQNFKLKKYLCGRVNRVSKMIDYAYYQTYGYKHISRYYRLMLFLYRRIDLIYKVFHINLLKKMSKYNIFVKDNFTCIDHEQFMTLYNQCLRESLRYFNKLNLD